MHALRIDLRILGLIREFLKQSNSNMRHKRLTSKGWLSFWGYPAVPYLKSFYASFLIPAKGLFTMGRSYPG